MTARRFLYANALGWALIAAEQIYRRHRHLHTF